MEKLLNLLHSILLFLEGKKQVIGATVLLLLSFALDRHLIAEDVAGLVTGLLSVLGFTAAGVGATQSYKDKLGALKK